MCNFRDVASGIGALLFIGGAVALASPAEAGGWTETILHSFSGGTDGSGPEAALTPDGRGGFYGTTVSGAEDGTVFALQPPVFGSGPWTKTIIHSFPSPFGRDGELANAQLLRGSDGVLYSETLNGGFFNLGAAYEMDPPAKGHADWTERVILPFNGIDGGYPTGGLVMGAGGVLFGNTLFGGYNVAGNIYELLPPKGPNKIWLERDVFDLNFYDGSNPAGTLLVDARNRIYGTASAGGSTACGSNGCGTVFELTPPTHGRGNWTGAVIHAFTGKSQDGSGPEAGLIAGPDGSLYGTTTAGGSPANAGTVFRLTLTKQGQWNESILHAFGAGKGIDGADPQATLAIDGRSNLYGTTNGGGTGYGVVFELSPGKGGKAPWSETILHVFAGGTGDGANPDAGVVLANGSLFGTTFRGGSTACFGSGCGTVYELTP